MIKKYIVILLSLAGVILVGFYACRMQDQFIERDTYEVIIVGSGPAGLTAGIYLSRGGRDTLLIEGDAPGGMLVGNPEVENWPGIIKISGQELMERIIKHAKHYGCQFLSDVVTRVDLKERPYKIFTRGGRQYKTNALVLAMGAKRKKLGCPGEAKYWKRGISSCATCDAFFYKNKKVVVVGGGAVALTEAHHLAHFAKEVIVLHRSAKFKTFDPIKNVIAKDKNVVIKHNVIVKEIKGNKRVTGVVVEETLPDGSKTEYEIQADGVFVAIGFLPNTKMFEGQLDLDEQGYMKIKSATQTSKEGVFAAGDMTYARYMQAVTAAGEGCKAALDSERYLTYLHAG